MLRLLRLFLLLLAATAAASAQDCSFYVSYIEVPPDRGDGCYGYELCAHEAFRLMAISINFTAWTSSNQLVWEIQVRPASFFPRPSILADTLNSRSTEHNAQLTSINRDQSWYFGLDGQPDYDQFDLVTVLMHEEVHAMYMKNHIAGDCLMNPIVDPGTACHCVTPAVLEVLEYWWVPTGQNTCGSAPALSLQQVAWLQIGSMAMLVWVLYWKLQLL